jgi:lycopene cyclase domain-containing protein
MKQVRVFENYTYLFWLFCFIGIPLLVLLRWRRHLWLQRRALTWTVLGSLVGGWLWDALAVRVGLWHYDPTHIAGTWYLGLPLEEWIWIVGVTLLFGGLTILLAEWWGVQHE